MKRVKSIRELLQAQGADVFLCTNPVNRRYLTGFTGSAGIAWISAEQQIIMTDFRYIEQVKVESPDWELVRIENPLDTLKTLVNENNTAKIAFEADHITVRQLEQWQEKLEAEFVGITDWVQRLRIVKTPKEIDFIRQAAKIGDQAFAQLLPKIRSGVSEIDLALELEFLMRRAGASGMSFSPIIASGPQSALPHAKPSERVLMHGDFVVFDFGCVVNGYCSDMTRTVVIGEPEEQHLLIYDLVLKAQAESLAAVAPGKKGSEIDAIARDIIGEGGYGEYFGHGLGHGVGLEIHENPRLSRTDDTPLEPGMVVTVEPGIYLPGFGGVRIEDLVAITEDGHEVLTSTFKELYIVE